MLKLGLFGSTGKMGQAIQQVLDQESKVQMLAAYSSSSSLDDLEKNGKDIDAFIDFSKSAAFLKHLSWAVHFKRPILIGTTGISETDYQAIEKASEQIPVLYAANTSLGVTVLSILVEQAAKILPLSFDIEICETHHRHKIDVPSGTALLLGEAAACGRQENLPSCQQIRSAKRKAGEIGFASMRGGHMIGDHAVHFLGDEESITLEHRGFSRHLFAKGALQAVLWLSQQKPGCYTMKDALKSSLFNGH